MLKPKTSFRKNGRIPSWGIMGVTIALCVLMCLAGSPALAKDVFTISSSSQVYEAFKDHGAKRFEAQTGATVQTDVMTSEEALARLVNGFSDMAAVAERLDAGLKRQGYVEIPVCTDDIALLTHVQTTVKNVTKDQLRGIFSGDITNWNQLGGPDKPLVVIVPSESSAAFRNFERMVMDGHPMSWDIMVAKSTMAEDIIRRIPWSLTFVAQGATRGKPQGAKVLQVNGIGPGDEGYPYVQTYSLVTKGKPDGYAKVFVDLVFSDSVANHMKSLGMKPLAP
ncbi:phosphate ABC transporter substrate-binding protein, PhoT family [Desulfatibacillum alkenivorans DSM 16219]|uniref:Phosphate ABC transporter substrate-binding protein, PhoT family n=1 Tax=Desulfatibacillum alkenivorans DSM 16219 TaxID=1121393 RepID=A0A1M6XWJ3_9BACT|nr:substrate-binding domain-containing protein [Desulfatibacillum alkenivorans]SHL10360.1 phosphate ABC transporter substrate-binding protein, PhoT family [Desulfatibacillum alkenivorans DSM 16219]